MLKLFAGLALACLVTPAFAAHHAAPAKPSPPSGMACAPVSDAKDRLAAGGANVLGERPIPYSHAQALYWTDGRLLFSAPIAQASDGSGDCLVIDEIVVDGLYVPETDT